MPARKLPGGVTSYDSAEEWKQQTGGKYETGADGNILATPAPHGFLDQLGKYAPYGIMAGMGYGALTGGAIPGLAVGGGTGAAGSAGSASVAGTAGTAGGLLPSSALAIAPSAGVNTAAMAGGNLAASGGSMGILGTLGKYAPLADILGGAGKGQADGRRADAYAQAAAGQVNLNSQDQQQKRAILASLLGGLQDASISRPEGSTIPTFGVSGGLRPSALTNKDALIKELSVPSPTVSNAKPGFGEQALGYGGLGLGILGQLGKIARPSADAYRTPPYAG